MGQRHARLQVVFTNLRRAVDDVILKHQATVQELLATVGWVQQTTFGGPQLASALLAKAALGGTEGAPYAHRETDGASHWETEGPAHLPDAPQLDIHDATAVPPTTSGPRSSPKATAATCSSRSCPASNPSTSSPPARSPPSPRSCGCRAKAATHPLHRLRPRVPAADHPEPVGFFPVTTTRCCCAGCSSSIARGRWRGDQDRTPGRGAAVRARPSCRRARWRVGAAIGRVNSGR